ncbi:MAG: SPOR domain-containing protein [Candidatus Omnitrophica bacterium]|nr:SPOR domain-containing protein [Candidatus Omnitrophota bacterium]
MDDNQNGKDQGELFTEISSAHRSVNEHQSTASDDGQRKKVMSFDKFLVVVLSCVIIGTIVYAIGIERGRRGGIPHAKDEEQEDLIVAAPISSEDVQAVPVEEERGQAAEPTDDTQDVAVVPASVNNNWTIQVVTYVSNTRAENQVQKLAEKGWNAYIIPSGKYYQVCVNRFATRDEARAKLGVFTHERGYVDAYVRKVNK